jgi:hypothetical protein
MIFRTKYIYPIIIDKANTIYSQYTSSNNDIDHLQSNLIDDTNTHLQIFFQHLEQLLQIDLKSKNGRCFILIFLNEYFRSKILSD